MTKEEKKVRARAQEFCEQHGRSLPDLTSEALQFWLDTCGEAQTEIEQQNAREC